MNVPWPTEKQARILWLSLTALAFGVLIGLASLLLWGVGWVINRLSSVLLPLAIAGIIAYLLDPVVDYLEQRRISRGRAIQLVFLFGIVLVLGVLATVIPVLVLEIGELTKSLPDYAKSLVTKLGKWLSTSGLGKQAGDIWQTQFSANATSWLAHALPGISEWVLAQLGRVASWAGLLIGLALVPVYAFYFLLEKTGIAQRWTDYLPIRESKMKKEVVFVLTAINDCLIVFFRGQVLVALADGAMLTVGFLLVGLKYAFLLGLVAGFLSLVPYLGITISIIPAVALAVVQFGDWLHPVLVLLVFAVAQTLEGLVVSPLIMGNRVGLHPLTIIVAVMIGTTLLGGILGGVLAIPLTAALRVLMVHYVWKESRPV
jgi:predicted PurR-regulated permease PerM